MLKIIVILLPVLVFAACGGKTPDGSGKKLTQAQRDSVLSETNLPGAKVVGKAIAVSDSAAARSDRLNKATQ